MPTGYDDTESDVDLLQLNTDFLNNQAATDASYREGYDSPSGGTKRELKAGWYGGVVAPLARVAGYVSGSDDLNQAADEASAYASGLSAKSGYVQSLDDVHGVGDALSWAAKTGLNMIPSTVPMLASGGVVGGGLKLAGMAEATAARYGLGAAWAASTAQQTGSNIDAQIEEGNEVSLTRAFGAGALQGALDVVSGVGGKTLGKLGIGVRRAEQTAEEAAAKVGQGKWARRWEGRPGAIVRTGAEEGVTEGLQQALEEAQRAYGSDEYDIVAGQKRIFESSVAGVVGGGAFGGVLGDKARTRAPEPQPPSGAPPRPMTPGEDAGDIQGPPDDSAGASPRPMTPSDYYQPVRGQDAIEDRRPDLLRIEQKSTDGRTVVDPAAAPETNEEWFTGATAETLRPLDNAAATKYIRGNDPLTPQVREMVRLVTTTLQNQSMPPEERAATARSRIDEMIGETRNRVDLSQVDLERRNRAIVRAADYVNAYEKLVNGLRIKIRGERGLFIESNGSIIPANNGLNLENMFGTSKAAQEYLGLVAETLDGARKDPKAVDGVLASIQQRLAKSEGTSRSQRAAMQMAVDALTDFKVANLEIAKRQGAAPMAASEFAGAPAEQIVEQPAPSEGQTATTPEGQALQQAHAEAAKVASVVQMQQQIAQQQMNTAAGLRQRIFDRAAKDPALVGKDRGAAFTKLLGTAKEWIKDPPTPEEMQQLGDISQQELDQAVKAAADEKQAKLDKQIATIQKESNRLLEQAAKEQAAADTFEPTTTPRKLNKQQQAAQARKTEATQPVQTSTDRSMGTLLKDVAEKLDGLRAVPDFAKNFGDQFERIVGNIATALEKQPKPTVSMELQLQQLSRAVEELKQTSNFAQSPAGTQSELNLEGGQGRAPKAVAPAPAPAPAATPSTQAEMFTEDGEPSDAALKQSPQTLDKKLQETLNNPTIPVSVKMAARKLRSHLKSHTGTDMGLASQMVSEMSDPKVSTDPAYIARLADDVNTYTTDPELAGTPKAPPKEQTVEATDADPGPSEGPATRMGYEPEVKEHLSERLAVGRAQTPPRKANGVIDVERIQGWANKIMDGWANPARVVVLDPFNPTTPLQQRILEDWKKWERDPDLMNFAPAFFSSYGGQPTVVINATVASDPDIVAGLMYHESLGHYGLKQAFGRGLKKILLDLWTRSPEMRALAAEIERTRPNPIVRTMNQLTHNADLYYLEEALVELGQDNPMNELAPNDLSSPIYGEAESFWKQVARMARDFLVRMVTGKKLHNPNVITMEQARQIVARAHAAVIEGHIAEGVEPMRPGESQINLAQRFGQQRETARQSQAIRIADTVARMGLPNWVAQHAITANNLRTKAMFGLMFGRDLVDYAKSLGLPSYERYFNSAQASQATARSHINAMQDILHEINKLDPVGAFGKKGRPVKQALHKYLKAATRSNKWGYQPTWREPVDIDPTEVARWDAFKAAHPEAAEVADKMFKHSHDMRVQLQDAVTRFINLEAAQDSENALTPDEKKAIEKRRARAIKLFDKQVPKLSGPYVPLARFGNYVSVFKSAELVAAEEAVKNDTANPELREQLDTLRADANHYAVFGWDNEGQAARHLREFTKENPQFDTNASYASEKLTELEQLGPPPMLQMQRFKDMVRDQLGNSDKFGKDTARQLDEMVKDLYLRSLAETSARKHDAFRENIEGASDDITRAFARKGRADANYIAQIDHQHERGEILKSLVKEAKVDPNMRADRSRVVNEILRRHLASMAPDDTPFQDKAMAFSSFYHLATSPKYYINNAMQAYMFAAPMLAGRYGVGAYGEMTSVYISLMKQAKHLDFWRGETDFSRLATDPNEQRALKLLQDRGLLEAGMQYDMGYWEGTGDGSVALARANHVFRTVSQQVEVLNRVSSGLTAYRLESRRLQAEGKSAAEAHDAAYQMMESTTSQTQLDYSGLNAPSAFRWLPKVVTQFKKYQLGMIALQGRLLYNATMAIDPKERAVARKAIGYMYSQMTLVAGVMGIPAMQLIGFIAAAIAGPDDEPVDGEKFMEDNLGTLIYRGFPTAAGFELGQGVGLGGILSPGFVNFSTATRDREGFNEAVVGLLGPLIGIGQNMVRGAQLIDEGQTLAAVGEMMPSGVRNAIRGYNMATEGLTKKNGDMLLDPDTLKGLLQAVGFPHTDVASAKRLNAQRYEYDQYFKDRQSSITHRYTRAVKAKDGDAQRDLIDAYKRLQDAKQRAGFKPTPMSNLLKAPAAQAKREANTARGVQYTTRDEGFVKGLTD